MYDASLTLRNERPTLNLLDRRDADLYLDAVREAALEALGEADLDATDPLLKDGFVYHMVLQHEYQHNETVLQTLQLMRGAGYRPETREELRVSLVTRTRSCLGPTLMDGINGW
jgi:gamma-glutamyl hercynylcysteine S-oxide synthase